LTKIPALLRKQYKTRTECRLPLFECCHCRTSWLLLYRHIDELALV